MATAEPAVEAGGAGGPRLCVVLPPGWRSLDLDDEARCARQVRALAAHVSSDDGPGARVRHETRVALTGQVDAARTGGATLLAIAGPEVPFLAGSLLVTPLARGDRITGEEDWLTGEGARVHRSSVDAGSVVRRVTARRATEDGDPAPSVAIDYWLRSPRGRTVHLAFSTPLVVMAEAMTDLFDAVVESGRWVGGDAEAGTDG